MGRLWLRAALHYGGEVHPVFNIEVFNACQMSFWPSKMFWVLGALHKNVALQSFHLSQWRSCQKIACHKIQWLQFVKRIIVGLQSWHFSKHFQIPIIPAISTLQLPLGTHFNFSLASTTTIYVNVGYPNIIGWRVIAEVVWNLKHWMHWCECHYALFRWKIWIGLKNLTLGNWQRIGGLCL